ncbi:MAG: inactive transglutaminase family protein [Gammaproteobacteria bacterium]
MRDLQLKIVALSLAVLGIWVCSYKVVELGLPLKPIKRTEIWSVEAKVSFVAHSNPIMLQLQIPNRVPGFEILDENFVSGNYGLATESDNDNRQAAWSVRRAKGRQSLYYRVSLYQTGAETSDERWAAPPYPEIPDYPEPYGSAVASLLEDVRNESADIYSFTRQLMARLTAPDPDENVKILRTDMEGDVLWAEEIVHILAGARIPGRVVYGLRLVDGTRHGALEPWLQVYDGSGWISFDPKTGAAGLPTDFMLWRVGSSPLVLVDGGRTPTVEFAIARKPRELVSIAKQRANLEGSRVLEFYLFSLPIQSQNVYRIVLMVPFGALLVVLMRNLIGIKTFGTFMPILIALAFRETELFWGVVLFSLIVALGLSLRFYLERLKLLLVPRLAAVLTIVVLLMVGISVISHRMGVDLGLSVALFPMVILAMTIERMSLAWEEHGPSEALQQGLGSLVVAAAGYFVFSDEWLAYVVFVFPELLLVVLAVMLLLGRYRGYRLTELWRFRALANNESGTSSMDESSKG